ncbi:MAG TPA: hypothetical protein VF008_32885 [Niastella sp.]
MEDKTLQEGKKRETDVNESKSGKDNSLIKEETPGKNDTDTEPDEFIGPDADTDLPIDGEVINDAVLRGEPHANIDAMLDNKKNDTPPKKDVETKLKPI